METTLLSEHRAIQTAAAASPRGATSHGPVVRRALGAALLLGVAGDLLLRAGPSGIGFTLFIALLLVALAALIRVGRRGWTLGAVLLLAPTLFFASSVAWRDAAPLAFYNVLALLTALAALSTALLRGEAWEPAGSVGAYLQAGGRVGVQAAGGAAYLLREAGSVRDLPGGDRLRHAGAVARGTAIALPLLFLFGSLLSAADPQFDRLLRRVIDVNLASVASHAALAICVAWAAAGYLRSVLPRPVSSAIRAAPGGLSLGVVEVSVVLASLDVLFLAFVSVQLQYLFGGAAHVAGSAGVTYAEYARRGFFELVWVAALALPTLLGADALLRRSGRRDERVFRVLAGVLVLLLGVVMISAMQRMALYQQAYGLTGSRLYASAGMGWLAIVFVLFAATVLRGRRASFAFGALVSAWAVVGVLDIVNPDALIARTNLARMHRGERFDADYLARLGADATPDLLRSLAGLAPAARCALAAELLPRPSRARDWRAWNLGRSRADRALEAHAPALRATACPTRPPPRSG